jgi:hypothetical protein
MVVAMIEVEATQGIEGVRFIPDKPMGWAALVVAGSSGRVDADRARVLAEHGLLAESIRWFGGEGQHAGVWEIPIETFLVRVSDLAMRADRVMIMGTSFGAEAALLAGSRSDQVDAVVAFAPSDVVWCGVAPDGRATSHWTVAGRPVPFVPFADDWDPGEGPPAFRSLYQRSREMFPAEMRRARIPVERIQDLVLVAGGDDQVWPSVAHAEAIDSTRAVHGLSTIVVTDPAAGHRTILPGEPVVAGGVRMRRGGDEDSDRRLGRQAWSQIRGIL